MGLFKKKKDDVLDLTEYYNKRKAEMQGTENETVDLTQNQDTSSDTQSSKGFFGGIFGSTNPTAPMKSAADTISSDVNERKQKLAKRLKDMTDKLEDVSNQIYHLQQRLELVERKLDVN